MHALICDDDEFIRRTLEHALTRMGYQVEAASSAAEALNILRNTPIRLVITDWEMPGMTGVELCQAVRSDDLAGYVYIIMLTSRDKTEQRVQALSAGADDFISKPFNRDELGACMKTAERILSLETRDLAMFALAKLAESRDPDTGAHIERVQCYSRALAQQLALTPKYQTVIDAEYLRLIFQTSPLHDIGKVGIPDAILLKPGKLDPAEFEAMKAHVLIGAGTLEAALARFPNAKFLQMARDIAATHHERFDGSGYPAKLSGENIPLSGRIVALADVYDALTSRRVYKAAMPHEEARNIIVRESGKHFDPDVVEAFLCATPQFLQIRERLDEPAAEMIAAAPVATEVEAPPSAQTRVLLVEDDAIIRGPLARSLTAAGYEVIEANDGAEALQMTDGQAPQIVISDWSMPNLDGITLCRELRRRQSVDPLHFIMLTVHSDKSRLVEAFEAGVDDFLSKPFDERELLVRVRAGVRAVSTQEELRKRSEGSLKLNAQLSLLNNRLERLTMTDELTGLFNRRHAMTRLEEQWALSDRYGQPVTIAMADIDLFKHVNDTLGHEAGDTALKAVASVLKERARATDVVCRFGGEEFLVVFPAQSPAQALTYADRCRAMIGSVPIPGLHNSLRLTVSIGIATRNAEMSGSSDLLRAADAALYAAKSAGRNCVRLNETAMRLAQSA
jgi:putative two-component system response regulator